MARRWGTGPHLDSDVEPWRATFPGLGTVFVDETGGLTIEPDPRNRGETQAGDIEAALRWGWGENLALVRQGYLMLSGSTVVAPGRDRALLLAGDSHDIAIVLLALASLGWSGIADRVTPFRWDGDHLVAHPRQAPVVVSRRRARKAGWEARDIRQDSNAVTVEVRRRNEPAPLAGVVQLRSAKASEPIVGEQLSGSHLVEAATALRAPGALAAPAEGPFEAPDDPQEARRLRAVAAMREDIRLAQAAPILQLGFDSERQDEVVDALLRWFDREKQ